MSDKKRLNLTVVEDFKVKALVLASKRSRSVSGLFEDLIEEEWNRLPDNLKQQPLMIPKLTTRKAARYHAGVERPKGRARQGKTSRGDPRNKEE